MKRLLLTYRNHLAEFGYSSPAAFLRWVTARLPEDIAKKKILLLERTLCELQGETFDIDKHEITQMEAWLELARKTYALVENDYSFTTLEKFQSPWMKCLIRLRNWEKHDERRNRTLSHRHSRSSKTDPANPIRV